MRKTRKKTMLYPIRMMQSQFSVSEDEDKVMEGLIECNEPKQEVTQDGPSIHLMHSRNENTCDRKTQTPCNFRTLPEFQSVQTSPPPPSSTPSMTTRGTALHSLSGPRTLRFYPIDTNKRERQKLETEKKKKVKTNVVSY